MGKERDEGFLNLDAAKKLFDMCILQDQFLMGRVDFLFPNADKKEFKLRHGFPFGSRQLRGLNSLVKAVLSKHLDRTELHSNWGLRPLRAAQLHFAGQYDSELSERRAN